MPLVTRNAIRCAGLTIAAVGLLVRLVICIPPLAASDDVHRYLHEGRVARIHLALPYWLPPISVTPPGDDGTTIQVNHPTVAAAYWPGVTLGFAVVTWVADNLAISPTGLWLSLLLALDVCVAALLWRRLDPSAAALWWLHPLWWLHAISGAHLDALGAGSLLLSLLWLARGRMVIAGIAVAVAVHAKPVALVWLLFSPMRVRVTAAIVIIALWLPHVWMRGPLIPPGMLSYAAHWSASPLLYGWLEAPWSSWFADRASAGVYAHLWLDGSGIRIEQSGQNWWSLGQHGSDAARLLLDERVIGKAMAALLWLAGAGWLWRRQQPAPPADQVAMGGTGCLALWLLLTPTMHPWYALWLLPGVVWLSLQRSWLWWLSVGITVVAVVRSLP